MVNILQIKSFLSTYAATVRKEKIAKPRSAGTDEDGEEILEECSPELDAAGGEEQTDDPMPDHVHNDAFSEDGVEQDQYDEQAINGILTDLNNAGELSNE